MGPVSAGAAAGTQKVIARLERSEDFERVLRARTRASSEHFALHYVAGRPERRFAAGARPAHHELSTDQGLHLQSPVDDCQARLPALGAGSRWFGSVVPKRHARRAVTRTLLKRQIRAVVAKHAHAMACGLWVVRLRAPFDRRQYSSAASDKLKQAARDELERLVAAARGK